MKKSDIFWQTYLNLEKELLEVAEYIYVTDEIFINNKIKKCNTQLETFSPHIANLIIRTCTEIEAISKELYFDFGGNKQRGDTNLYFDGDCLKLIDDTCNISNKIVLIVLPLFNLTDENNKIIKPLKNAYKRKGTNWEKAYQALKHDRYSSIHYATIRNLIHALGALYLLNIYYRDISFYAKYIDVNKLDLSLGSSIFSVKMPKEDYVIGVINGNEFNGKLTADESPFVLKYKDEIYNEIIEVNKKGLQERNEYLYAQPELEDPDFIKICNDGIEKQKSNPHEKFILSYELFKYRINKNIPSTLPFEERRKKFVNSVEWNKMMQMGKKNGLTEEELTPENIQSKIDFVGYYMGMQIEYRFITATMQKAFHEGYCELVLDKGNVKYKSLKGEM